MPGKLVFVIDDEPAIGRLIKVNLEHKGYVVETSQDSIEALERLRSGAIQPHLILSDVIMPYLDGFELLTRLKADPELKEIPVVLITARSRDADLLQGYERGAAHYITKPIVLTELFGVVQQVLGEEEAASGT